MQHFYESANLGEDWFTYAALYQNVVKHFPSGSHFVEVGSWKGKSSVFMAVEIINSGKQIKFDCVDIWTDAALNNSGYDDVRDVSSDTFYNLFLDNIEPVKHIITPIRMCSWECAKLYEDRSLDFVFIDGDHSYEGVTRDLAAWYPKIKQGGVLAGHDYAWTPHIQQAVSELLGPGQYHDPWGCGCFVYEVP